MKKFLILFATIYLVAGCSQHVKTAIVNGHLNVMFRSHEAKYEREVWEFVVKKYETDITKVTQPDTHSGKKDFVQAGWESLSPQHTEEVLGFYNPNSNFVLYVTGELGVLAHEYCHALNHQLKINVTYAQDQYFCNLVQEDYEGNLEIERLRRQNKDLQRELRKRSR